MGGLFIEVWGGHSFSAFGYAGHYGGMGLFRSVGCPPGGRNRVLFLSIGEVFFLAGGLGARIL